MNFDGEYRGPTIFEGVICGAISLFILYMLVQIGYEEAVAVPQPYVWCSRYQNDVIAHIPVACFKNGVYDSTLVYREPDIIIAGL